MILIYRSLVLDYCPTAVPSRLNPQAVNWRFRIPEPPQGESFQPRQYQLPPAINWRFRIEG